LNSKNCASYTQEPVIRINQRLEDICEEKMAVEKNADKKVTSPPDYYSMRSSLSESILHFEVVALRNLGAQRVAISLQKTAAKSPIKHKPHQTEYYKNRSRSEI
jgi:hypothetical protein